MHLYLIGTIRGSALHCQRETSRYECRRLRPPESQSCQYISEPADDFLATDLVAILLNNETWCQVLITCVLRQGHVQMETPGNLAT